MLEISGSGQMILPLPFKNCRYVAESLRGERASEGDLKSERGEGGGKGAREREQEKVRERKTCEEKN